MFLFGFPSGASQSEPVSFSDLIETKKSSDRLNLPDRFIVAQTIVKAVTAFHADGWVHKSKGIQSIKFFQNNGSLQRYSPYLVDFEYSRPETTATNFTYDMDDQKNIYRHPDRQEPPSVRFSKMHGIYALGVVLLEIGLWRLQHLSMAIFAPSRLKRREEREVSLIRESAVGLSSAWRKESCHMVWTLRTRKQSRLVCWVASNSRRLGMWI